MSENKVGFLKNIPFFTHLPEENLAQIADVIEQRVFNQHEVVFHQNDEADGMYIIIFGEVEVAIDMKVVAKLGMGDFFGEIALITSEPRTASIGVVSPTCSTLFLSKEAFDKIKYKVSPENQKEILRRIYENSQR
ncbi:MAG: cyclic nucleotide-binding domain-containing protein [Minisyncoccales bacterium]